MSSDAREEEERRSAALQKVPVVFLARQRAEGELVAAKETLHQSEAQLRLITDATPALIAYIDSDCRYRFANSQYGVWFGHSPQHILGCHMRDVLGDEAFRRLEPAVRRALSGEKGEFQGEVPYRVGGKRYVEATYLPDRAADGSVCGIHVMVIDVSDRKRSEQTLRQTENRLQMAMQAGQMGAWEWDVPTGKVIWSPTLEAIHGLAANTFGGTFEDFQRDIHPEDRELVLSTIRGSLEQRTDYRIEYRILKPDAALRWIEARGKLLLDEQGRPERMAGLCMDVTDRKKLEEVNARLAAVVEFSEDAIVTKTLDSIVATWNKGAERMFGYLAAEMIGQSITILIPPDCVDEEPAILARIKRGEVVETYESVRRRKDGSLLNISLTVSPIKDAHGKIIGASKIARNITQRKQADAERARLASVLEKSLNEIYIFDTERLLFQYVNEGSLRNLGYSMEQMRQMTPLDLKPEFTEEKFRALVAPLLSGQEQKLIFCTVHRRADGSLYPVEVHLQCVAHAGERVFMAVILDITERRKGEEERDRLLRSEQRARAHAEEAENRARFLAEASASLASTLDYEATLGKVAQAVVPGIADWCVVHMREPEDSIRVVATAHFDPAKLAAAKELQERYPEDPNSPIGMPAVLRSGQSQVYSQITDDLLLAFCRDAEHLAMVRDLGLKSAVIVPLIANGQTLGAITLVAAESDRHFTEADLPFAEDLAARAATAAENARLYREVRHANTAKDHFLAVLSHELRTPLNPVLMTVADLERDDSVPAHIREQMAVVRRNVELEARLIDDLLDSTRIANGKLQLQRTVVDIRELLRRAMAIIEGEAEAKGVNIIVRTSDAASPVDCDPARVQQVFWNVVKNAVKFTPTGGSVHVASEIVEDRTIRVSVKDDGIGIAAENLSKIFNAFEQGDAGRSHRFGGLGLGLAISKALVTMHEGTLTALSEGPGRGATFVVEFPLTGKCISAKASKLDLGTARHALRLLVVEDHVATADVMTRLLTKRGYSVTTAGTAQSALEQMSHTPVDLLITDLGLPDGSGLDLLQKIRASRDLPAIALSGYGTESDFARSREAGFACHLTKPVDIELLDREIQSIARQSAPLG